jgi:hypothetical protein
MAMAVRIGALSTTSATFIAGATASVFGSILGDSTNRLQGDMIFLSSHKEVTGKEWLETVTRSKLRVWTSEIRERCDLT